MKIQAVTLAVSEIQTSENFYVDTLGLEVDKRWSSDWVSFKFEGKAFLAILRQPSFRAVRSSLIVNIIIPDVHGLWRRLEMHPNVVQKLDRTPWGSLKFVITDPDGYQIGFVQEAPSAPSQWGHAAVC